MKIQNTPNLQWCRWAMCAGGILTIVINACLTPLIASEAPFEEVAASPIFLWRQGLSAMAALCLLVGSVGLFFKPGAASGGFARGALGLTFAGSAFLLAHEWNQVFFVRDLAIRAPETLEMLVAASGPSLPDIGAMIAIGTFSLGWLLFSIAILWGGVFTRRGPLLLIVGMFAAPSLSAVLPGAWGAIIGSAVMGLGWIQLGREL